MNAWTIGSAALVFCLFAPILWTMAGPATRRLSALQMATTIATLGAAAMSFALSAPSAIDLALTIALLGFPAAILFAVFAERWL